MSTEEERELRQQVIAARAAVADRRGVELFMAGCGVLLVLLAFINPTGLNGIDRQLATWIATAFFLGAACNNLYGNIVLQPGVRRAQEALNRLLEKV